MTAPRVLFEDGWLLAVDKPPGLAVHGGAGLQGQPTVHEWAARHLGARATRNGFTVSAAHRLDRETSGVLLLALRRPAAARLSEAFARGEVEKRYLALVAGVPPAPRGRIERPLDREDGPPQDAITLWQLEERLAGGRAALLACAPRTGRKHQLRRHLAALGHPVLGDAQHGDAAANTRARDEWGLQRLFLHAASLELRHPGTGEPLRLEAGLPAELRAVLEAARLSPLASLREPLA